MQFARTIILLLVAGTAYGQGESKEVDLKSSKELRISALIQQLRFNEDAATLARYRSSRDEITAVVDKEVDDFIGRAYDAERVDVASIRTDLGQLLRSNRYDAEYSGPPFAAVGTAGGGRCLLVGYMISRGGVAVNDSSVTLRAYQVKSGRFSLVALTGTEFNGYGLYVKELDSPFPSEQWILAWGPLSGFNGRKVRIRIYSFDGEKFKAVWDPPDRLNAEIEVQNDRIVVTRLDEERFYRVLKPPYSLREEYRLTREGVEKVAAYSVDQP